jgi:hypothetical protein
MRRPKEKVAETRKGQCACSQPQRGRGYGGIALSVRPLRSAAQLPSFPPVFPFLPLRSFVLFCVPCVCLVCSSSSRRRTGQGTGEREEHDNDKPNSAHTQEGSASFPPPSLRLLWLLLSAAAGLFFCPNAFPRRFGLAAAVAQSPALLCSGPVLWRTGDAAGSHSPTDRGHEQGERGRGEGAASRPPPGFPATLRGWESAGLEEKSHKGEGEGKAPGKGCLRRAQRADGRRRQRQQTGERTGRGITLARPHDGAAPAGPPLLRRLLLILRRTALAPTDTTAAALVSPRETALCSVALSPSIYPFSAVPFAR